MPSKIQVLPDKIVNQIAAGEVIGRPASVVKELMENALDAGASEIGLIVKDSGKSLVRVVDDGEGMTAEDAVRCFDRHATSKITDTDDLFRLNTMGFRGEALASIAAIAQVELKTRQEGEETGRLVRVEGSAIRADEACQTPVGTSISIRNIFFNVPARRNFLKTDAVETRHIIDEFLRIALAHPAIAFTMHHNDREIYHLRPANLRQRIVALFGSNYNERLVPVEEDTEYVKVRGFIGKPDSARRTRGEQYFFLNGRFIRNPYLNHAVTGAYGDLLPDNTYPLYILNIDIDPSAVDVNVHPTKQEVKFEDEKSVYMIVQAAVKHGLAQYHVTPSIDFEQEASFRDFEAFRQIYSASVAESTERKTATGRPHEADPEGWKQLYEDRPGARKDIVTLPSEWEDQPELSAREDEGIHPVQLHRTYILAQIKSGIMLIHQHFAHQRILFERYLHEFEQHSSCQRLLFPVRIRMHAADAELMKEILVDIRHLGFDLTAGEDHSFTVSGMPSDLVNENPQQILENMLERFKWNAGHEKIPQRENIARSLARFAAIPAGRVLEESTMKAMIDQLFGCGEPETTPDGRRTFIRYSLDNLRQQFEGE